MKHHGLAIGLLAAVLASTTARYACAQQEIRLAWQTLSSAPSERTLVWSETPALPAAAVDDLTDLRSTFLTLGYADAVLLVNENGRSAAATAPFGVKPDPTPASGVTIWPDWQIADATITFDDVSKVKFLSGNHILISQHPDGGPYVSYIVDIRRPTTRFQFSGYRLGTLRVTDAGKWAALAFDGTLCWGQFDPGAGAAEQLPLPPDHSVMTAGEPVTGTAIPVGGTVRNLIWLLDGLYLLVEREGPVIDMLRPSDWSVASSIAGGLGPVSYVVEPAGRDSCLGYQMGVGASVFTISKAGAISVTRWPSQVAGEGSVSVSPLRKFLITQKTDNNMFPRRYCRKTPYAAEADVPPSLPSDPNLIMMQDIGWLLWMP